MLLRLSFSYYLDVQSIKDDKAQNIYWVSIRDGETELGTPEVDTSGHFCNTRSRCIKQNPELGTPELGTPELDTSLQFQK